MVFFHFGKYPPFSIIFPITTYIILFQHSTFPELTSPKCCDFSSALTHLCTWSSWQRGEALKRWTLIVYNLKFQMWREMFCLISEKKHINLLHPGGESTGSLCGQCVGTEGKQWLRNQSLKCSPNNVFKTFLSWENISNPNLAKGDPAKVKPLVAAEGSSSFTFQVFFVS